MSTTQISLAVWLFTVYLVLVLVQAARTLRRLDQGRGPGGVGVMIAMGETGVIRIELGIWMMVDGEMKGGRSGTLVSGKGRGTIVGGIKIGIMGGTKIEKGRGRGTEIGTETEITGGIEIGTEIDMTVNEIMPETEIGGAIVLAAKESVMIETEIMNEVRSEGETREIGIGREKRREGTDETETDCDTTSAACSEQIVIHYTVFHQCIRIPAFVLHIYKII